MSVEIHNMSFQNCRNGTTAITFSNMSRVYLLHVDVLKSHGSGVILKNITSHVIISYSSFNNSVCHGNVGAGVVINITTSPVTKAQDIVFSNCMLSGNRGPKNSSKGGGGLTAELSGDTTNVRIVIRHSHFHDNTAEWGAGLYVIFTGNATNNSLHVYQTTFQNNSYVYTRGKY